MSESLITGLVIFVLATFLGAALIGRVPPTLHTPLMSGANAISGITLVGALLAADTGNITMSNVLGFVAIVFAMINVVGGFAVTTGNAQLARGSTSAEADERAANMPECCWPGSRATSGLTRQGLRP